LFLRDDHGLELAGGTAARSLRRMLAPALPATRGERWHAAIAAIDWTPDLGARIGSRDWWRGLATCTALCTATWFMSPGFRPVLGDVPAPLTGAAHEEARAQAIAPLAWGGDTGRRMAAGDLVVALAEAPERPSVDMTATLGEGDGLASMLARAGVGRDDAAAAAKLIGAAVGDDDIAPGTRVQLTLGRRPSKLVPRPLDRLAIRARFDLALTLTRAGGGLTMTRQPIAVDTTPWRLQGLVGASLYRSLRAAGAPAKAAETYIRALATRLSIGRDVDAADSYDLVIERAHAATGETRLGALVFAGLNGGAKPTRLVRWTQGGKEDWYDADGQTERRGEMGMPVAGHITSTFGWRMHPLLGFMKMHKGLDIGAAYGSPIHAVVDGTVSFAGRAGGYGNFVKVDHAGGLVSGYGHMSRIAVRRGEHVARGEVIGYVGSTGLSTGPHLHWEIWRGGVSVNPRSISFDSIARLSGGELAAFKARVAGLMALTPGK
jgi:murein DD-endopeptidase MepM/ murein hydrolase activator NlpD